MKNILILSATLLFCSGAVFADNTTPTLQSKKESSAPSGWQRRPLAPGEQEPHDGIEIIWQDPKTQQNRTNTTSTQTQSPSVQISTSTTKLP